MTDRGTIHVDATLTPGKLELLGPWMRERRWYAGKDHEPLLRRVGGFRFEDPAGQVGIETILAADVAVEPPVTYQVPLTYRGAPVPELADALVGTIEHSVLGTRWVYDGCQDLAYVDRLLALILGHDRCSRSGPDEAFGHLTDPLGVTGVRAARILTGEQSNTSIICATRDAEGAPGRPVIIKVFRTLQDGDNPDVTVQTALSAAHCHQVPAALGQLTGSWLDPSGQVRSFGHLAFAQEFYPNVEDAWRVASRAALAGRDFADEAYGLGAATATIHRTLAVELGRRDTTAADRARILGSLRDRAAAALAEVPALGEFAAAVADRFDAVPDADWPALQRIHGDYHLGQVLAVPDLGWVVVDFEGEPLRPLAERNEPDLAARDIAGMLRSFDYAAGTAQLAGADGDTLGWLRRASDAFLRGYEDTGGPIDPTTSALVSVLMLDKALYEAVYEARNRPQWIDIPLRAIRVLLDPSAPTGPSQR